VLRVLVVSMLALPGVAAAQHAVAPAPPFPASGTAQVAFTPWEDAEGLVVTVISEAQRQILVQAFSFTSKRIAGALIAAKRRGVEVLVMADHEQARLVEGSRIRDLAGAGIPVWLETRYAAAHSKVMIIDASTRDAIIVTGSFNWTVAAQRKNAENLLVLRHQRDLAQAYAANWQRQRDEATRYAPGKR
jgi:phosphatidylserine/phosphatidylglycerophosphate/cardiolipin synthase-like enzyme